MAEQPHEMTDFGFQSVTPQEKTRQVFQVFSSVARKYDIMNDIMSLGMHRLWKRFTIACSGVHLRQKVLDLAGGTGDLALQFARLVGPQGRVILTDINDSMLKVGRDKLRDRGAIGNVHYVQADAEALPFADNYFDCVTIAFGLRNITNKERALAAMWRVLKPGGRLLVLEFSKPPEQWLRRAYDRYSFHLLPRLGQWVVNDRDSYRYLVESIRRHPDQQQLTVILQQAGFEQVNYHNLTGGIVALHRGYKL